MQDLDSLQSSDHLPTFHLFVSYNLANITYSHQALLDIRAFCTGADRHFSQPTVATNAIQHLPH